MYIYQNIADALTLWDAVDEDSSIWIAVIAGEKGEKSKIFAETEIIKGPTNQTKKSCVRVFVSKDDAYAYKTSTKTSGVTIAKTTLGSLIKFLSKNFLYSFDTEWECVLSTIDIDGRFYGLDLLWSNYQMDN